MADRKVERRETQAVEQEYHLRLFVAGREINSQMAIKTLKGICSQYLKGHCRIEIIDVLEDYQAAIEERVIVAPALVIKKPFPRTVIFGNLSDREKVLRALGIGYKHEETAANV